MALYLCTYEPCRDELGRFAPCGGGTDATDANSGGNASSPQPAQVDPFGDKPPRFFDSFHDDAIKERSRELFGKEISAAEVADLVGAPNGSYVSVYRTPPAREEAGLLVQVYRAEGDFNGIRHVYRENGRLVMKNELLTLHKKLQGQGIGTSVFARQVESARRLGVQEIHTTAAKNKNMNGYYTWPRVGYNADLPGKYAKKLPDELKGATTFHELYAKPGGREWWKANGGTVDMHFNLQDDSSSLQVFNAYLAQRGRSTVRATAAKGSTDEPAGPPPLLNTGDFPDFNESENEAAEKVWDGRLASARGLFLGPRLQSGGLQAGR